MLSNCYKFFLKLESQFLCLLHCRAVKKLHRLLHFKWNYWISYLSTVFFLCLQHHHCYSYAIKELRNLTSEFFQFHRKIMDIHNCLRHTAWWFHLYILWKRVGVVRMGTLFFLLIFEEKLPGIHYWVWC